MADETLDSLGGTTHHAAPTPAHPTLPDAPGTDDKLNLGARIGRYVILSKLGAGAMGVVVAAYDPVLDRKVALKLLKARGGSPASAQTRLQREAQALAKLDHRNVVTVHDVGEHDGQLFIGMEFVAGRTLRAWMGEVDEPRPWREVLRVFAAAGEGLAAAHDAGLIHRDFKPDNVMLGDDGRVRVMDFGLARAGDEDPSGQHVPEDSKIRRLGLCDGNKVLDTPLTQTGALMGTPAYMSVEQLEGRPADALSDQFGYCVALYEALYGERPFAAHNLAQLLAHLRAGRVAPPLSEPTSPAASVPAWLRKIVVRGLSPRPEGRFASMHELLAALADDPYARYKKRGASALLAAMVLGLVVAIFTVKGAQDEACAGMDHKLSGVWDDERRAEVEAAFEATKLGYAAATWTRVAAGLDDYAGAWISARRDACLATRRGEQSDKLLDLRMACLDGRLERVRAAVDLLASADAEVVEGAVSLVSKLPGLSRCASADALAAELPPPEDEAVAASVAALDGRLAEVEALEGAGKYAPGRALAVELVAEAETLDYEPLLARAYLRRGFLEARVGEYEAAEATLLRAYDLAVAQRMIPEAAQASARLSFIIGYRLGRPEDAQRWVLDADPFTRALGSSEDHGKLLDYRGMIAEAAGHLDEAESLHEQALALKQAAFGPEHLSVAFSLNNLGNVAHSKGDYDRARDHYEGARALWTKLLGPEHPMVAAALNNLGNVATATGDYDLARAHHEAALELREASLGPRHPMVAASLNNLGDIANKQLDHEAARRYLERSLEIKRETLGPDHPDIGYALLALGESALVLGDGQGARAHYERARELFAASLGPTHVNVLVCALSLAETALSLDEHERARAQVDEGLAGLERELGADHPYVGMGLIVRGKVDLVEGEVGQAMLDLERGLSLVEASLGPTHPVVAEAITQLGLAHLASGQPGSALEPLERALELRSKGTVKRSGLGETRFALASALWDAPRDGGRDRARARELAALAQEDFAASPSLAARAPEVEAWLRDHPSSGAAR